MVRGRIMKRCGRRGARDGFSVLEILLTVSIFGIAMAGLTTSQLTAIAMSRSIRDQGAALDAAESVLEAIRDEGGEDEFRLIFARWNATPDDDPAPGAPGNAFDVRGLEALANDPDGRVGEIVFPGDGVFLRENGTDRLLGMPRDLDVDGKLDGADHAANYGILPVLVRVRWRGPGGINQVQLVGTIAQR